ncbi:helix-turn-helix transcriptional regulator [Streptomyces syringium]|uniref:helix-turn-helix transcriptional regulator n=1 Tax=Streptomyces syringium TaxID=76729 RepID=UPI00342E8B98
MTRPQEEEREKHPLAKARAVRGLSQKALAEKTAVAFMARFGWHMSAWRTKVAGWETKGIPPTKATQLALADVFNVPEEEVVRLGWPYWLLLVTGDAKVLTAPWTLEGAIHTLRATQRMAPHQFLSHLTITGSALATFTGEALTAITAPSLAERNGYLVTPDVATMFESRFGELQMQSYTSNPVVVLSIAHNELSTITELLTESGYDQATGSRLLLAASRLATLCGHINERLGSHALAEQYHITGVRTAVSAGSSLHTSGGLVELALAHADRSDPLDALSLIEAARSITPTPPPRLAAVIYAREARAYARLRNTTASAHALDRAAKVLATSKPNEDTPDCENVNEEWLSRNMGRVWFLLGRPRRALEHFTTLLTHTAPSQSPLSTARALLDAVDAQLAVGDIDAAVGSSLKAAGLFDVMPAGLTCEYRIRLTPHRNIPAVRNYLDYLATVHAT